MKNSVSALLLFVVLGYAANAQKFTLLPQAGIETFNTLMQYNGQHSFSPKAEELSRRLGVRMDYSFKKIGGPYIGVATSRSSVAVNLSDPEAGMNITSVSPGAMQLRLEAGYQVSSKPIYFNKSSSSKKTVVAPKPAATYRSGCGSYCSRYRSNAFSNSLSKSAPAAVEKGWYVSIQPSVGVAYLPVLRSTVSTQTMGSNSTVTYLAGNMSTALVAGTGFEFGENTDKKFNVSVQYIKGIGNLDTRSISTSSGSKPTVTNLGSSVSGWNLSIGIPISLSKKKTAVKQVIQVPEKKANTQHGRCGRYYSNYMRSI